VGAIGVIVVMLSVLPMDRSALSLYRSEARQQKILPSVRSTVQAIGSIYLLYSVLAVALLWALGEPLWRALNHGLTAIATGGFAIVSSPLAEAGATLKLAYAGLAIAGAMSFVLHYRAIRTGRGFWSGLEVRAFWLWLAGGALILIAENAAFDVAGPWLDHAVTWVMAVTTAGFAGPDLSAWPAASLLLLTLAASAGAMAGSTGGGLKLIRVLTLGQGIAWSLRAAARTPHQVMRYVFDGEALDAANAARRLRAAATLAAGWLILGLLGVFAMLHFTPANTPFAPLLFEVFAIQSNAGLSAGAIDPAALPAAGKLVLLTLMWMGRLEIVPAMVLLALFLERR
jgi:trk system potassium uptake protein TrkH